MLKLKKSPIVVEDILEDEIYPCKKSIYIDIDNKRTLKYMRSRIGKTGSLYVTNWWSGDQHFDNIIIVSVSGDIYGGVKEPAEAIAEAFILNEDFFYI